MLWALIAITILGFTLLALGIRGRVVGDEPRCCGCRFDLSGIDSTSADAICPECASRLAEEGAVRTGLRKRRRGQISLGVLLLLPLIGILVASPGWTAWNSSKPTQVLLLDGRFGSKNIRDAAVSELVARQDASVLSTRETRSLLRILAEHVTHRQPKDLTHAGRLFRGHQQGNVEDVDWDDLVGSLRASVQPWVDSTELPSEYVVIRDGQGRVVGQELAPSFERPIPFAVGSLCVVYRLERVTVDDQPIALVDHGAWKERMYPGYGWGEFPRHRYHLFNANSTRSGRVPMEDLTTQDLVLGVVNQQRVDRGEWEQLPVEPGETTLGSLQPGSFRIRSEWAVRVYASEPTSPNTTINSAMLGTLIDLGEFTISHEGELMIVGPGDTVIEPVSDTERLATARDYVNFVHSKVTINGRQPLRPKEKGQRWLYVGAGTRGQSAGLALFGELWVEVHGQRVNEDPWPVYLRPDQGLHTGTGFDEHFNKAMVPDDATVFDIVFVPDLKRAAEAAGPWLTEHATPMPTAAEEIRWENIPITPLVPEED